jgi:hypothetical protein
VIAAGFVFVHVRGQVSGVGYQVSGYHLIPYP